MNPVRACMVDEPAHYRWGSYRANVLGQDDEIIVSHEMYRALDADAQTCQ